MSQSSDKKCDGVLVEPGLNDHDTYKKLVNVLQETYKKAGNPRCKCIDCKIKCQDGGKTGRSLVSGSLLVRSKL